MDNLEKGVAILGIVVLIAICIMGFIGVMENLEMRYNPPYFDGTARVWKVCFWEDGSFQLGLWVGCHPSGLCGIE